MGAVDVEEVAHLLRCGESHLQVAKRLGMLPTSVGTALRRLGAPELARGFERRGLMRPPVIPQECACGSGKPVHLNRGVCQSCVMREVWQRPEYREKKIEEVRSRSRNKRRDRSGRYA